MGPTFWSSNLGQLPYRGAFSLKRPRIAKSLGALRASEVGRCCRGRSCMETEASNGRFQKSGALFWECLYNKDPTMLVSTGPLYCW